MRLQRLSLAILMCTLAQLCVAKPSIDTSEPDNNTPMTAQGVLVARHIAVLSSQMSGVIDKLTVREGDSFSKGQLLLGFDCTLQRSDLGKAQARLKSARATYNANARLKRLSGVSEVEYVDSQAKFEEAKADLTGKTHAVKLCDIVAPFNGRAVKVDVKLHESVKQGEPLLEIIDNSQLTVEFILPSIWLRWLKIGSVFSFNVNETHHSYPGRIIKIIDKVDSVSQSVKVIGKLDKNNPGLIAGMSGEAKFTVQSYQGKKANERK